MNKTKEEISLGGYLNDESKWTEIQVEMIDAMNRLEKTLTPFIHNLNSQLLMIKGFFINTSFRAFTCSSNTVL